MYNYSPDWAAWFSGIATVIAVIGAVGIAVWSSRQELRREDRKRFRQAQAMAAPIHHEIFMVLGQAAVLRDQIDSAGTPADRLQLWRELNRATFATPGLERYALQLDPFEGDLAAKLSVVLLGASSIREFMPSPTNTDEKRASEDLRSIRSVCGGIIDPATKSLDPLRAIAASANFSLPDTELVLKTVARMSRSG